MNGSNIIGIANIRFNKFAISFSEGFPTFSNYIKSWSPNDTPRVQIGIVTHVYTDHLGKNGCIVEASNKISIRMGESSNSQIITANFLYWKVAESLTDKNPLISYDKSINIWPDMNKFLVAFYGEKFIKGTAKDRKLNEEIVELIKSWQEQ